MQLLNFISWACCTPIFMISMKDNTSAKKRSADDFPWHRCNQECVTNLGNWDQQRNERKKSPLQRKIEECLKDSLHNVANDQTCVLIFSQQGVRKWESDIFPSWSGISRGSNLKYIMFLLNFIESLLSCIKWIEIYLPILVPTVIMYIKSLSRCMPHSLSSTVVSSLPSLTPNIFTKWYSRLNEICLYNRSKHCISLIFRRSTLIP